MQIILECLETEQMQCKSVIFSLFNTVQLETQTLWQCYLCQNQIWNSCFSLFFLFFFFNASPVIRLKLRKTILVETGEVKTARKVWAEPTEFLWRHQLASLYASEEKIIVPMSYHYLWDTFENKQIISKNWKRGFWEKDSL